MIRIALRILLVVLASALVLALAGLVALRVGAATWAVNRLLTGVKPLPGYTIRTAKASGNGFTWAEFRNARLIEDGGPAVVSVERLRVRYDLRSLFSKHIVLHEAQLLRPRLLFQQRPDSSWIIPKPPRRSGPKTSEPRRISIGHIRLMDGDVLVRFGAAGPDSIRARLEAEGAMVANTINLSRLSVRSSDGSLLSAAGIAPLTSEGRLDLSLTARSLLWRDLRFLGPKLNRDGEVGLTLRAAGTRTRLELKADAASPDGGMARAEGVVTLRKTAPQEYRVQANFRGVDPALLLSSKRLPRRIDGEVTLDLAGPSLNRLTGEARVSARASPTSPSDRRRVVARARFDDGHARVQLDSRLGFATLGVRGWVRPFDSVPSYDLAARARQLKRFLGEEGRSLTLQLAGSGLDVRQADLRALAILDPRPGPSGLVDSGSAEVRLRGGTARIRSDLAISGGTVALAGTARLGRELEVRVHRGSIQGVDLAALLGDSSASELNAKLTLESRGTSPEGLRAQATIADVDLSYGAHEIQAGTFHLWADRGNMRLTGQTRLDGGLVEVNASAYPFQAEPSLTVKNLRFRQLDLARLLPKSGVPGEITGVVQAQARGRRLHQLELSSLISIDPSQIGPHPLTHARIEVGLARGRAAIKAEAEAPAGSLTLTGSANPFDSVPRYVLRDLEFEQLDLGRLLSLERVRTRLAGTLRAEGSGRQAQTAGGTGLLTLRSAVVNDAEITAGRFEARLAGGRLDLSAMLRAASDSLRIEGTAHPFEKRPRVRLAADLAIETLAPFLGRDSLDAGGTAAVRLEGELGPPDSLSLRGELLAQGRVADVKIDSLRASAGLAGGVLTVNTLSLGSSVGSAAGSGTVALFGPTARTSTARLTGRLGDIAALAPLLGVAPLALDSGSFTASIQGPRDRLRLGLVARGSGLRAGSRRVGALQASLAGALTAGHSLAAGTADVRMERLVLGKTRVRHIQAQGSKQASGLLIRVESVVDQERSARVAARVQADSSRLQLDTLEMVVGEDRWSLAHPVRVSYGDRIQVEDFRFSSGPRRIVIDGVVDRRGEQRLTAAVDSLRLSRLVELFGVSEMDGLVNGTFKLTGPAAAPQAEGSVSASLASRKKPVGDVRGRLSWSASGLLLDLDVRQKSGDSLKLNGRVPVALSLASGDSARLISRIPGGKLAVDAVTDRFRLEALGPLFDQETIRDLKGQLAMNAHVVGTLESPQLSGSASVADARIRISRLGATYDKGQIRLALQGRQVTVTGTRLESGGGKLETSGSVRLEKFPAMTFDLQTRLSKFRVANAEDIRSRLSGTVNLGGATAAPVVTGSLEVSNTDFYLQAKNLQASAEEVELTPEDLRTLEERFGYDAASRSQTPRKPLAPWKIGLKVQLTENNWLRRTSDPVMAVELGGKLDVRKAPNEDINVFGQIKPLPGRSFVQMLGRRFEMSEGVVTLNGPLSQAAVAVKAEYQAPTPSGVPPVLITTAIRSDTGKLSVTLSSIPAMRSDDIMSYLTTGRPASSGPTVESVEQDAVSTGTSLAVGAAIGTVAGGAGQALGLDVIQVLQDREGGQTLVAGKYVSPPLYLGFRQPIVPPTTSRNSESELDVTDFEVEYATYKRLLLNLQGGGNEVRFFIRLRR